MSSTAPAHNRPDPAAGTTYQAAAPHLQISVHVDGPTTELHLAGELDLANANELRGQVRSVLDRYDPQILVVDLSRLDFADSTGLAVMVWAHKQLTARARQLTLRHPNPQVSQILDITGLDRHLPVIPTPQPPHRSDQAANAAVTRARATRDGDDSGNP